MPTPRTPNEAIPDHPRVSIHAMRTLWRGYNALQQVEFSFEGFRGEQRGPATWEVLRRGRAVAVIPYDPARDAVVLIEQFRLPALAAGLAPWMIEVAAGLADGAETDEAVALRETLEETGLTVTALAPIGRFMLSPGVADETITMFAGRVDAPEGLSAHAGLAAEHEDIRVSVLAADAAFAMLDEGAIVNITTALALMWLRTQRERLRREWSTV